jgi:hypothetical protein
LYWADPPDASEAVLASAQEVDGVHKATSDGLEKQNNIISAYIDEVTKRNERIAKLEADHQKAVPNANRVLDSNIYIRTLRPILI